MKTSCLLFVLALSFIYHSSLAQKGVVIPNPSGYSSFFLRYTNGCTVDKSGNLWVAFNTRIGLGKYNGTNWTVYDSLNSPLVNNRILSVAPSASGVWAGTTTGLYHFDGSNWMRYSTSNSSIPFDSIPHLYSDSSSDVWMYSQIGFVHFNGTTFNTYNTSNSGLADDSVRCIYRDASGILWVGTRHGLSSFNGVAWTNYTKANSSLADDHIRSLVTDKNNLLFAGTEKGHLFMRAGNGFKNYRAMNGDYAAKCFPLSPVSGAPIVNLHRTRAGTVLLAGAYSESLSIMDSSSVTQAPGLYSVNSGDTSAYYAFDGFDRLWRVSRAPNSLLITRLDSIQYDLPVMPFSPLPSRHDFQYLDINEVSCPMWNDNIAFYGKSVGISQYEAPKGCGKSAFFAKSLWIGGLDAQNKLHLSAETYRQKGTSYWPGPLDTITASIDSVTSTKYDSIWKTDRWTVDNFINQYKLGNVANGSYIVPSVIRYWPAHGTGTISRNLAPFVDFNGDGIYNPYDGDYPDIKGDQMLWWVMNDRCIDCERAECAGASLGIEIQAKAYAYTCSNIAPDDEAVNYTTFYSYNIINRSDTDYHDVYIGIWSDPDVGNYLNDFVGCSIAGNYGFAYNSTNYDGGLSGYNENPPMSSVVLFKDTMKHFFYYYDPNPPGNPRCDPYEYYNYMQSIWPDNIHLTYGGDGRGGGAGGTSVPTNYMYSGTPYDTGWTELNSGSIGGDRRFILSAGPFTLPKHQSKTLDYALVFSWDRTQPNGLTTSVARNHNDVMSIKRWFDTDSFPCKNSYVGVPDVTTEGRRLQVYPNPSTGKMRISGYRPDAGKVALEIYNVMAERVLRIEDASSHSEIDVSAFAKGVYFIQARTKDAVYNAKVLIE